MVVGASEEVNVKHVIKEMVVVLSFVNEEMPISFEPHQPQKGSDKLFPKETLSALEWMVLNHEEEELSNIQRKDHTPIESMKDVVLEPLGKWAEYEEETLSFIVLLTKSAPVGGDRQRGETTLKLS